MLKPSLPLRGAKNWLSTLRLPRSTFPPRPLESVRPAYLKRCSDDLYALQSERPADRTFVFHDGPPYANGALHIGHALNKILKDIICRFKISQGCRVQYIPGWDCHGLPIETKALRGQGSFRQLSAHEIRSKAKSLATVTIQEQKEGFKQWAVLGDWDNAYQTMEPGFELRQLRVFKDMVKQGIIYRQFKPVHWSPSSGTALAEAELEYDENHESLAAYVKFEISNIPPGLDLGLQTNSRNLFALIWTTTPWTIPANRAIGINAKVKYCVFRVKDQQENYLVGQDRLDDVLGWGKIRLEDVSIISRDIFGQSLVGNGAMTYVNLFRPELEQPFLPADFVSEKSGTGLVHMAPGHGFDDYNICRSHNINAFSPVDDQARFTSDAYPLQPGLLEGKEVLKEGTRAVLDLLANPAVLGDRTLKDTNLVWATHKYTHSYPIDWRTKLPTIVIATAQWFADVGSIKNHALEALDSVQFLPESGKSRLESFISGRSQWCISRQRVWGVPIPAIYASDGRAIMSDSTVEHIIKVIQERGIDAWWMDDENNPVWIAPGLPADSYKRSRDTMDVWFDSGTSWALLQQRKDQAPADVYLEGTDQHRGWFQSSLLTYLAHQTMNSQRQLKFTAPFKTLITHGFTLDHTGRKMSKSEGNVVSPQEIMSGSLLPPLKKRKGQKGDFNQLDTMGPDALRLWVASSDYTRDITVGPTMLKAVNASLHKYRITLKWLLGALADYKPAKSDESAPEYRLADRIALVQLSETVKTVHSAYDTYDFVRAVGAINNYVNSDLSAFYFETAKDHLYTGGSIDRLRVQNVCHVILKSLLSMLGPALPLLVTEVVDHASTTLKPLLEDPLFTPWGPNQLAIEGRIASLPKSTIKFLFEIHAAVKSAQESARTDRKLGMGLDCHVMLQMGRVFHEPTYDFLQNAGDKGDLADMFVVSSVTLVRLASDSHSELDASGDGLHAAEWSYHRDVELALDGSRTDGTQGGQTLTVLVQPPRGDKCPRCWRSVVDEQPQTDDVQGLGGEAYELSICNRCRDVVAEMGEANMSGQLQ